MKWRQQEHRRAIRLIWIIIALILPRGDLWVRVNMEAFGHSRTPGANMHPGADTRTRNDHWAVQQMRRIGDGITAGNSAFLLLVLDLCGVG